MRARLWFAALGSAVLLTAAAGAAEKDAARPALSDYFPPPESKGGWRTLLPARGDPDADAKAAIAGTAGVDWDKLREAWDFATQVDGSSGLLVIRKGHVVGEWYKDGDAAKTFNIYSSSKAYTSLAYGLLVEDSAAGKLPGGRRLTLETKVCNAEWLPESLPLSDSRKADITVHQLLNMASGLGEENVKWDEVAAFETALGHTADSPFKKLKSDPGAAFHYSNAGVAHLVLLFNHVAGKDLFPFLKERVLDPVGVEKLTWHAIGGNGHLGPLSQGFSGIHTTPREHARFCYLALHKGEWAGRRLVPAGHYDFAWTPSKTSPVYGAQWWLAPRFKGAPPEFVATLGAFSNDGFVVPSLDLVVVRLGDGKKLPKDFEAELARKVLAAVKK